MMYNKSQIMKDAWALYKSIMADKITTTTFANCLKTIWKDAKKKVAEAKAMADGIDYNESIVVLDDCGREHSVTRWTKYGKDRLYINGTRNAYYDIQSKKLFWSRAGKNTEAFCNSILF